MSWHEGIIHLFTCLQLESMSSVWKFLAGVQISTVKKRRATNYVIYFFNVPHSSLFIVNCFWAFIIMWQILLAFHQSLKTDTAHQMRGGGEQHGMVLCCSVIFTSLRASLLKPKLSHGRQKVALHFHLCTDEDILLPWSLGESASIFDTHAL